MATLLENAPAGPPSSPDSPTPAASSPPSLQATAPSSPPSKTHSLEEKKAKLDLADQARLIQDNARILQLTADSNRAHREQALQLRQAEANKTLQELGAPVASNPTPFLPKVVDDMGDILIDSPITHHNYPPPQAPVAPVPPAPQQTPPPAPKPDAAAPPPASGKPGLLTTAALLGGALLAGGGGALAVNALSSPSTPTVSQSNQPTEQYRVFRTYDAKGKLTGQPTWYKVRIWPDGRPMEKQLPDGTWVVDDYKGP